MFSNKMFRLSPTFQVFYSTRILRGSYRYWGRYQIRSLTTVHEFYKDRANQLGGPIPSNPALKGPCYHRNTRALTIARLERFIHCRFLPHSLLRTLLKFFNRRICQDTKSMALNQAAGPKSEVAQYVHRRQCWKFQRDLAQSSKYET